MTKYITIMEVDSGSQECLNVGTITTDNIEESFKTAIESHFDAEMISFHFVKTGIEKLDDCINAYPIDVKVSVDNAGEDIDYRVELSETWLYL